MTLVSQLMGDIGISKAAYYICMRRILLWLWGVGCCCTMGADKQLKRKQNAKYLKSVFTKNVVGGCTDAWLSFLSAM